MIYDQNSIKQLGTILGVWAHPDDETWTSAGLMAAARANNQDVHLLCMTRGEAGRSANPTKWPSEKLASIRTKEMHEAMSVIDINKITIHDFPDGNLSSDHTDVMVKLIGAAIEKCRPDTIITFGPLGITGHNDHKMMNLCTRKALNMNPVNVRLLTVVESKEKHEQAGKTLDKLFNIYFAIDKPERISSHQVDVMYVLPKDIQNKKMLALQAHASQTYNIFQHQEAENALQIIASCECFIEDNNS